GRGVCLVDLKRGSQKLIDLASSKNERKFLVDLRQLQLAHLVAPELFSVSQESVKSPERGKLQPDIGAGLLAFHEREKITAEIVGGAFVPRGLVFATKRLERFSVGFQRAGRSVSFEFEIAQELVGERIARHEKNLFRLFDRVTRHCGPRP